MSFHKLWSVVALAFALLAAPGHVQAQSFGVYREMRTNLSASVTNSLGGGLYSPVVSNPAGGVTSASATLTVLADTTPPTVLVVTNVGLTNVVLVYSEPVELASSTNTSNYAITNGVAVLGATLAANNTTVTLITAPLSFGVNYGIVINGVCDRAGNPNTIATNTLVNFKLLVYAQQDLGGPSIPSSLTYISSNAVNITASGSDVGGIWDQAGFFWQLRTGDFDVSAQLSGLGLSDAWAKAGLMGRETLDGASRFAAAVATPSMNGDFFEWRDPAGGTAGSSGNFPANFPYSWLRLKRAGNVFSGYASYDGQVWSQLGSVTIAMTNQIYVGLFADSHVTNATTTAQFQNIADMSGAVVTGTPVEVRDLIGPTARMTPIAFAEIMYKPAARTDSNNVEYVKIYNSNPWFQNIGGYQIVCADMSYTFPAGTVIAGGAYLCIAASPSSIQGVYGITNVMGPYTGSLKKSETLQLLDEVGSVLLTVPYSNVLPWPVGAEGTGHSLALANPTYGEGDPRAWDISYYTGGSPGGCNYISSDSLDGVVINEFLAHTDPPLQDAIELYNHGNTAKNLSGAWLAEGSTTNKFQIPNGTTIPARGFVYYQDSQLGFRLDKTGDKIFLWNSNQTRIIDAVNFEGQENGVSMGRVPDGSPNFYRLASLTLGTNNGPARAGTVIINELMYDPISGNDADQYVELYNRASSNIDLSGWQFTSGITYTFPTNTILAVGGYLVVAADAAHLMGNYTNLNAGNCLGNFGGRLSHNGERVVLAFPHVSLLVTNGLTNSTTMYVPLSEVTYGTGGRWGQWAAGGGSSLELIDPNANTRLAANWADSDETQKAPWTNIECTGVLDNGGNYDSWIDYAQVGLLDVGECLVDNFEIYAGTNTQNLVANPTFESGVANWTFQGDHVRSGIETNGYNSTYSLHMRCSDRMWTGVNSCELALLSNTLGYGQTATLRFKAKWQHGWPEVLLRLNGNWLEATGPLAVPSNLGTPGLPNSRKLTNAGPAIYSVTHTPAVPAAAQPVVVTACVDDPNGATNITLYYRLDPAASYTSVAMKDDGTGGDAIAKDGIYSATIPGQASGQIIAYYISASDAPGATTRFPALVNDNAPVRECVVMFGDGNPGGSFGVYHLWITQTNVTRWTSLSYLSNEAFDCTMVNGNRVIYNAQARFAGSPYYKGFDTPTGNLCQYKWIFPDDDKFLGATSFNKIHQPGNGPGDDTSLQREQLANTFLRALGVPWLNRRYVAVYVNGNRRGTLMEDAQCPDGDTVKEHWPNDSGGWLYKMQPWCEFGPAPSGLPIPFDNYSWCNLMPYTTTGGVKKPARYRYNFLVRRTPYSANDFTNAFTLVDAANSSSSANYVANLQNIADMENWMRVFAANHSTGNGDSFGAQNGQNLYGYIGAQGTKYSLMMWDFNIVIGNSSWGPGQNLFVVNGQDPNLAATYNNPTFRRMYWRALQELVNGPLDLSQSGPLVDAKYAAFTMNGQSVEDPNQNIKGWLSSARSSIASQIAAENTTNFMVNASVTISNNIAYISGSAPVNVKSVMFNGEAWPLTWTSVTGWTASVVLQPGTNFFSAVGMGMNGQAIAGDSNNVQVVYNGAAVSPMGQVVINEIMYAPTSGVSYVELLNVSTNTAFDLSGWNLHGLSYTFPSGSLMAPRAFLTLASDTRAFSVCYGATNTAFDQFSGALDPNGETLTLQIPGIGQTTVVDRVRYEAVAPWPVINNGASLQLIDPTNDNSRVGNWGAGRTRTPQWTYFSVTGVCFRGTNYILALSAPGDVYVDDLQVLTNWQQSGSAVISNGGFESGLSGWTLGSNYARSSTSTNFVHSGTSSLHIVCSAAGGSIMQLMQPPLSTMPTGVVISGWFMQNTNNITFTAQPLGQVSLLTFSTNISVPVQNNMTLATPQVANSITSALPVFPRVWLNEVQPSNTTVLADNFGEHDPWVELYNAGSNALSLSGLYLSDSYSSLTKWAFPTNAAIPPNGYLIVWCDAQPNETTTNVLHASFRLMSGAGSVALSRIVAGAPQIVDYLNYTNVPVNWSYGDVPDGQPFYRDYIFYGTPGSNNASGQVPSSFIPYTAIGSVYAQAFDALPNPGPYSVNTANPVTINGVTCSLANPYDFSAAAIASGSSGGLGLTGMAGWYGGGVAGSKFGATDGDQTTGGQISFGPPNSTNRALGLLATSSTGSTAFGAKFLNETPNNLSFITVQCVGEVWRQSNIGKTLTCHYYIDPTAVAPFTTNVTDYLPALNVSFATVGGDTGGVAVDGTAANNQTNLAVSSQLITAWPPGTALWLVWEMDDSTGKAQGLAIDNLNFSASNWPANMTSPVLTAGQDAGNNLLLNCPTVQGVNYQVQFNNDLSTANWLPYSALIPGSGAMLTVTNAPGSDTNLFLRFIILPQ